MDRRMPHNVSFLETSDLRTRNATVVTQNDFEPLCCLASFEELGWTKLMPYFPTLVPEVLGFTPRAA